MKTELINNVRVKDNNITNVLRKVHATRSISRAELAKELSVTPPTVSMIADELIAAGLVREKGVGKSIGGRKPILLEVNPDFGAILSLDIRSGNVYYGIFDFCGERLESGAKQIRTDDNMVAEIIDLIRHILENNESRKFLGIGISVSGVVLERKTIKYSSVFNLQDVPLKRILENEFHLTVIIEERVRCASVAQMWFNPLIGASENFVYVHVGKGIGANIVSHGKICYGTNESAGEFGHMIIQPDGPVCSCGSRGCLETLASENAMIRMAQAAIERGSTTVLSGFAERGELTGGSIVAAAEQGDEVALVTIQTACKYLAIGLINVIRLFDPLLILIMNSISDEDELLKKHIFRYVNEYSSGNYEWKTKIEIESNKFICLDGAAAMVLDDLFTNVRDKFFVQT